MEVTCHRKHTDKDPTAAKKNSLGLPPFLTPEEAAIVLARIEHDRGDAAEAKPSFKSYLEYMKDWKMWEFPLYLLLNVGLPPAKSTEAQRADLMPEHGHHRIRLLLAGHPGWIRLFDCTGTGHDIPAIPSGRLLDGRMWFGR